MIYLTSNTFFGRKKALDMPSRSQYSSVESMDLDIINSWNSVVNNDDTVYHLGYFAHDPHATTDVLDKLNGTIIFFNSGTDRNIPDIEHLYDYVIFYEGQILEIPEKNVVLSYYPLETWSNQESYHFYGDDRIKTDLNKVNNRMNISFDTWKKPISLDECIEYIKVFNK